jgi:hypothetical protein
MLEQEKVNQSRMVGYGAAVVIFLAAMLWTFLSR